MSDIVVHSNLVRHARRELEILGADEDDINDMLTVIQAFANVGMSGSQAAWHIALLPELLQFKNLTPLTDDSKEWTSITPDLWQNKRRSDAFSTDGGRTYYLLSEGASMDRPDPLHISRIK